MRVLVTGAGGFLGSTVVRTLLSQGVKVVAMVRSGPGRLEGVPVSENLEIVQHDLSCSDTFKVSHDNGQCVNVVINAVAAIMTDGGNSYTYLRDNALATANIVSWARKKKISLFVQISSTSIYGKVSIPIVDEKTSSNTLDNYGLSKLYAERLVEDAEMDFPSVILRLPGILGRRPSNGPWLVEMAKRAQANATLNIFNPDARFNAVMHVQDIADFLFSLLCRGTLSGAECYNLATINPISIREAAHILAQGFKSKSKIVEVEAQTIPYLLSCKKAVDALGYEPAKTEDVLMRFAEQFSQ